MLTISAINGQVRACDPAISDIQATRRARGSPCKELTLPAAEGPFQPRHGISRDISPPPASRRTHMGYKWGGPHSRSPLPLALQTEDRGGMKGPPNPRCQLLQPPQWSPGQPTPPSQRTRKFALVGSWAAGWEVHAERKRRLSRIGSRVSSHTPTLCMCLARQYILSGRLKGATQPWASPSH